MVRYSQLSGVTASREQERLQVFPQKTGMEQQNRKLLQLQPHMSFLDFQSTWEKELSLPGGYGIPPPFLRQHRVILGEG